MTTTGHIMQRYLQYKSRSECPKNFHRWSILSAVGTMLERRVSFQMGGIIYPNMYVMLVGSPATRKSTAINSIHRLLAGGGYDKFASNRTSKQQFMRDLAESTDDLSSGWESVNSCYINTDEFLDFIGMGNTEFTTLLTHLWDNHSHYKEKYTKTEVLAINPTVNLLSGVTPTNLQLGMPPDAGGTGFLSRTIMVYGEPSGQRITFPPPPDELIEAGFMDELMAFRGMAGCMTMTDKARELLDAIYQNYNFLEDSRLAYYNGRRLDHLVKLIMVVTAMYHTLTITEDHVLEANTILVYTEESMHKAFGEFGRSKYSEVSGKVIAFMEGARRPVAVDELYKAVQGDLDSLADLFKIIDNLIRADRIQNSGKAFILKRSVQDTSRAYTDFNKYILEADLYEQYRKHSSELAQQLLNAAVGKASSDVQPVPRAGS